MRELLIGDLHFGVKTNSTSWLESQIKLFKKLIIPTALNENVDRIVFLGDLFDIRYSLNIQVGIELKKIISELAFKFKGDIIFIAGNHDFYSPLEELLEYNSYSVLFGDEFNKLYPNIKFVIDSPYQIDDSLFLPWYYTENPTHFDEILYTYKFGKEINAIYCHADLNSWPGARITSLKNIKIYAGHIHYIVENKLSNTYNVGAALQFNFGDANQQRYIYILEDHNIVKSIENTITPKFYRIINEKIFEPSNEMFENSYIQLCISESNIKKADYIEQIRFLKERYISSNIRINIIDDNMSLLYNNDNINFNMNIDEYIKNNIPEELKPKYELIKKRLIES